MPATNEVSFVTFIAETLQCKRHGERFENDQLIESANVKLKAIKNSLPSGSGFDNGTYLVEDESGDSKLVFETAYHHMNSDGFYCGWTHHVVTITPSFVGKFDIKVSGVNKNDITDYIADIFSESLRGKDYYTE